jgi:hypothetical protein
MLMLVEEAATLVEFPSAYFIIPWNCNFMYSNSRHKFLTASKIQGPQGSIPVV